MNSHVIDYSEPIMLWSVFDELWRCIYTGCSFFIKTQI